MQKFNWFVSKFFKDVYAWLCFDHWCLPGKKVACKIIDFCLLWIHILHCLWSCMHKYTMTMFWSGFCLNFANCLRPESENGWKSAPCTHCLLKSEKNLRFPKALRYFGSLYSFSALLLPNSPGSVRFSLASETCNHSIAWMTNRNFLFLAAPLWRMAFQSRNHRRHPSSILVVEYDSPYFCKKGVHAFLNNFRFLGVFSDCGNHDSLPPPNSPPPHVSRPRRSFEARRTVVSERVGSSVNNKLAHFTHGWHWYVNNLVYWSCWGN